MDRISIRAQGAPGSLIRRFQERPELGVQLLELIREAREALFNLAPRARANGCFNKSFGTYSDDSCPCTACKIKRMIKECEGAEDRPPILSLRQLLPSDGQWAVSEEAGDGQPSVLNRHDVILFGQGLHIYAVRVGENNEPVHDPDGWLDSLYEMDGAGEPYHKITIPGYPGEWVLVIVPYCE